MQRARNVVAFVLASVAMALAALPALAQDDAAVALPDYAQPMLDVHNAERARVGAPPLVWNPVLQEHATAYAQELARLGRLVHSPREGRGIERENLQQVIPGWSPEQMLDGWLSEERDFVAGVFPEISQTGDWNDVSHYSQMIWPTTTDLGCGLASGGGFQWLVCRYSPGGNKPGHPVGIEPDPVR
jgi:hypothetical protein